MFRSLSSLSSHLRQLALLVLAFWLAAHPVLGSLAEVHELAEHGSSSGSHAHVEPAPVDDHEHHPGPARDTGTQDGHRLLHLAHCCGHGAAVLMCAQASFVRPDTVVVSPSTATPALSSIDLANPFRPPIAV